jgi:putative ABC transport system permease protein
MAFRALKDRKVRSVLTILGIVIGSALIVALVASTGGLSSSVASQIAKTGVTTISISPTSPRDPLKDQDIVEIRKITGVKDVFAYYSRRMNLVYGSNTLSVSLYGIDQKKLQVLYKGLGLTKGAFTNTYDSAGVIVGSAIANPPSSSFLPVGVNNMLVLQGGAAGFQGGFSGSTSSRTYSFIVRGILAPYGAAGFLNIDEAVFMSLAGALTLFRSSYYSGLYVIAESADVVDSLVASLQTYYGRNARVSSSSAMLSSVQSITSQMTIFLGAIATVSLFVAGVGIANTTYVSVIERTREIGVLKALGFKPRDILSLFLSEAVVTGLLGSIFGTLVGVSLSYFLGGGLSMLGIRGIGGGVSLGGQPGGRSTSTTTSFSPVFSMDLIVFSLAFPIVIAIIAGFYPARRASRMNIVTALKYE